MATVSSTIFHYIMRS